MEKFNDLIREPGVWSERIYVVTDDYEICGYVFLPKIGKKSRALTDILNGSKKFIAIKDCDVKNRADGSKEHQDYIQLSLSSIILLRPAGDNKDFEQEEE